LPLSTGDFNDSKLLYDNKLKSMHNNKRTSDDILIKNKDDDNDDVEQRKSITLFIDDVNINNNFIENDIDRIGIKCIAQDSIKTKR